MKYRLLTTNRFDKQLKNCLKRGYEVHLIEDVLRYLSEGETLPAKYKAHKLKGKFNKLWECHILPDWLLIWEQNETELVLLLMQTGTHSDLFG